MSFLKKSKTTNLCKLKIHKVYGRASNFAFVNFHDNLVLKRKLINLLKLQNQAYIRYDY